MSSINKPLKYKNLKKYIAIFTLAIITTITAQGQVMVNLPLGKQFKVTTSVFNGSESEMSMANMNMNINTVKSIKVITDKNDKLILAITNEKMDGDIEFMGKKETLSSEGEADGPFKELVNNFKNEGIVYYNINKKTGSSEMTDIAGNKIKDEITDVESNPMAMDLDAASADLKLFKLLSPNVKVGDKFSDSVVVNGMTTISNYVVSKLDNTEASLDVVCKITGTATNDIQGQGVSTTSNGTGTGIIIIDRKTSITKRTEMNLVINMTMEMGSETMEMTNTTKTITVVE